MKVKEISLSVISETYDIRKMCELYASESMIFRAQSDRSFLEEIKGYSNAMSSTKFEDALKNKFEDFFANETKFHMTLLSSHANQKLIDMYKALKSNSIFFHEIVCGHMILTNIRFTKTNTEHEQIISAIENHDLQLLRSSLSVHIDNSLNFIFSSSTSVLR